MSQKIRIMLVEDNSDYRLVIEHALEPEADIELVSQFSMPEIAIRHLEDKTRIIPDLILLDLRLPRMDGLESLTWFRKALPRAKIIILTQSDAEADVLKAIQLGASGYLLKSSRADQLIDGIRSVIKGGSPIDANIAHYILNRLPSTPDSKEEARAQLTKRQIEILSMLAEGYSKKELSNMLSISVSTVNTHVEHIYQKLGAPNAPAAVSTAYKSGILPTDTD